MKGQPSPFHEVADGDAVRAEPVARLVSVVVEQGPPLLVVVLGEAVPVAAGELVDDVAGDG